MGHPLLKFLFLYYFGHFNFYFYIILELPDFAEVSDSVIYLVNRFASQSCICSPGLLPHMIKEWNPIQVVVCVFNKGGSGTVVYISDVKSHMLFVFAPAPMR